MSKPARRRVAFVLALASGALATGISTGPAQAGEGEGFFYTKGPKTIPDGQGDARLKIETLLPNDIDPIIDDVDATVRVNHARTRDLVVKLKRPNYTGSSAGAFAGPQEITLSKRDTRGDKLGKGSCPDAPPTAAPPSFTTFDDEASQTLEQGSNPYDGVFKPIQPLAGFNGYHARPAPDTETWRIIVEDRRNQRTGKLLCAGLFLHRF